MIKKQYNTIILCCAIYDKERKFIYTLPRPYRHFHILYTFYPFISQDMKDQGFLSSEMKWVNREEAYAIALNAQQLHKRKNKQQLNILFSEDMW